MSLFWYHLFTTRTTHMLRTCSPNLIDLTYTIMGTEFVTVEKYSKELSQWKKKWDQHITNGNIKVIFSWDDLDCRKYKKKIFHPHIRKRYFLLTLCCMHMVHHVRRNGTEWEVCFYIIMIMNITLFINKSPYIYQT